MMRSYHARRLGTVFFEGIWRFEILTPEGRRRKVGSVRNSICGPALDDMQDVYFRSGTQRPNWYAGLIDSSGFLLLDDDDTLGSHAGWSEFTGYTQASRPQWSPAASSEGRLLNGTAMQFTMTAPDTLQGLFLASNATKGGTTGLLWSTAEFDSPQSLVHAEVLRLFYDLTAAAGSG